MSAMPKLNYFDFFCLPHKYLLDKQLLTQQYKEYQKVLHPDKYHNTALQDGSNQVSAFTGAAYFTLMDDI